MKLKNELSTDRDDNIPIKINIEEEIKGGVEKISISAKLEKSGGFDYDPNIGAVSLLSFLSKKLRVLNPPAFITITGFSVRGKKTFN